MTRPACLVVCVGKDCRAADGFEELLAVAGEVKGSCQVPCQDLCHGPIAAVRVGDEIRWFHKLRGKRLRRALVRSVERQRVDDELRPVEVRKRRDDLRHGKKMRPLRAA